MLRYSSGQKRENLLSSWSFHSSEGGWQYQNGEVKQIAYYVVIKAMKKKLNNLVTCLIVIFNVMGIDTLVTHTTKMEPNIFDSKHGYYFWKIII